MPSLSRQDITVTACGCTPADLRRSPCPGHMSVGPVVPRVEWEDELGWCTLAGEIRLGLRMLAIAVEDLR